MHLMCIAVTVDGLAISHYLLVLDCHQHRQTSSASLGLDNNSNSVSEHILSVNIIGKVFQKEHVLIKLQTNYCAKIKKILVVTL